MRAFFCIGYVFLTVLTSYYKVHLEKQKVMLSHCDNPKGKVCAQLNFHFLSLAGVSLEVLTQITFQVLFLLHNKIARAHKLHVPGEIPLVFCRTLDCT
jgi:hypothetical protein